MINEQIRDREIRLIGSDGEQLGIMSAREAMKIAQEAELDLVKIAPSITASISMSRREKKKRRERNRKRSRSKKCVFLQTSTPMT